MRRLVLALVVCWGCGGTSAPSSGCTEAVCPAGGQRYQYCTAGGSCRYLIPDGSSFTCNSCNDCTLATAQISAWCAGRTSGGTSTTSCDVVQQNCIATMKCVAFFDGTNLVGKCVADGTVSAGQPCSKQDSPDTLLDNCRAGLVCDNLFGSVSRACQRICTHDSDCGPAERCGDFLYARAGWGWCAPTCTPFSFSSGAGCPSGMDCGETVNDVQQPATGISGFFLCKHTGGLEPYDGCISDSDCGAGLWCGVVDQQTKSARCLPICDDFDPCPVPPQISGLSASCQPFVDTPDHAGYCTAF
jgi:hypothetical protein